MNKEEYEKKKQQILEDGYEEIDEHESAGEYGDAENARKWMRIKLEQLEREYKGEH